MIPAPDISQTYPKTDLKLDSRFVVGEGNARDLSSDANTGTLVTGRAAAFDGTGDYLDCGAGMDFSSTGGSFALWVKITSTDSGNRTLFETSTNGSNRFALGYSNGDHFRVSWYPGVGSYVGKASTTFSQDTWYHLVGTIDDSNNTTLYMNGVSQNETFSALGISGTNSTAIGAQSAGGPAQFAIGNIAGAKAFDVVLTAAQALELYSNPEQVLPTGVAAANLKRYYSLSDYGHHRQATVDSDGDGDYTDEATSQNGLYFMDLGADKVNALAYNGHMSVAEQPPCPQLGLMPSISRVFFDGADDLFTITQDADIDGLFATGGTFSCWVFINSVGGGSSGRIIDAYTGYRVLLWDESGGSIKAGLNHSFSTTDGVWNFNNRDLDIGAWNHFVVTYNGSDVANNAVMYVNGSSVSVHRATAPVGTVDGDDANKIIGNRAAADRAFDGYISEVAMFKAILDADAVTAIYNSGVQGVDLSVDSGNYDNSGDLKGWWKMNNAFTVQDLTSYNNDATASGSPVLSVIPEGATAGTTLFGNTEDKRADNAVINLDGHSYVTIPHDVNLNPDVSEGFTVSVWIKYRNLGNGAATPVLDKSTGNDRWHLRIRDDSTDIYQLNLGDGTSTTDVDGNAIADNDWHHIVYTLASDGSDWTTATYYRDGASVSTTDISARDADTPGTDALTIGSIGTTASLNGAVAYPKIYARVLAANEIKLLYSSGLRVVGGL